MIRLSAKYYLGRSLNLDKQPKKAIEAYQKVIDDMVKNNAYRDTSKFAIAKIYIESKRPDKARPYLEELVDPKSGSTAYREKAKKLLEEGEPTCS